MGVLARVGCTLINTKAYTVFRNLSSSTIISSPSASMLPSTINFSPRLAYGATNGAPSLSVSLYMTLVFNMLSNAIPITSVMSSSNITLSMKIGL